MYEWHDGTKWSGKAVPMTERKAKALAAEVCGHVEYFGGQAFVARRMADIILSLGKCYLCGSTRDLVTLSTGHTQVDVCRSVSEAKGIRDYVFGDNRFGDIPRCK